MRALGDVAEECHRAVQDAFSAGRLSTRLDPSELGPRYTIGIYDESLMPS